MGTLLLVLMQTLRVLPITSLPHPPPPPRPQPLAFSSLSLKTPAKAVPPTPGTVLQNKIQRNLEKSLGDSLNIHIQQQMGSFQASMLESFQSLREELAVKKPAEVDPSPHASKAGPSSNSAAHLDLPPPRSSTNAQSEAMDVDVGPALPPRLVLNQTSSDQYIAPSEAIPKDSSYSHKKQSHRQTVAPSSASDQLDEDSDEPRIHPRPKKHSDKSKHKSRSRYVSSSEEDHSPVEYHLDSALVRPTHERWLTLQDLILRLKSKRVLTARCLMSLIGLLASTEKMVPEGRLHMRPFQFHLKEHWRYPQSLDNLLPWTEAIVAHLDWWQNPTNVMKGADLHPKDHSIQLFTDASNEGWGAHLDQNSTKGLWSEREKRLHINVLELKAVSLALRDFKDQCQNQTVLVATDNSTVVAYINKQGGTHSAEMCALLWKIMTWCHHYHITLKARHIPGCLNVMADLLSRSNRMVSAPSGLQANLPEVVHPSCRLIRHSPESQTPSICVSYPRPKGLEHRCSEHKLDQPHGLRLPSYGSPSQGDPKDQTMPLPDHRDSPRLARDALVLGPSAALNRDPTTTPSVNDPTQTVPQLCVPQQSTTAEPPCLVSRSGQLQEQGFSVEVAERIAAPQRSSTRTIYRSKWALFEKWCRENSVDFSTPSVKQISDFFMYLYQDLNRRPSTIDGYRTAIVDTLGPTAQHIAHNADLHRLLSSFHRDRPKSSRNLPKWNLSVVLNELTKAPFEPMKDSDLKHLTLKTAFLLALAYNQVFRSLSQDLGIPLPSRCYG